MWWSHIFSTLWNSVCSNCNLGWTRWKEKRRQFAGIWCVGISFIQWVKRFAVIFLSARFYASRSHIIQMRVKTRLPKIHHAALLHNHSPISSIIKMLAGCWCCCCYCRFESHTNTRRAHNCFYFSGVPVPFQPYSFVHLRFRLCKATRSAISYIYYVLAIVCTRVLLMIENEREREICPCVK